MLYLLLGFIRHKNTNPFLVCRDFSYPLKRTVLSEMKLNLARAARAARSATIAAFYLTSMADANLYSPLDCNINSAPPILSSECIDSSIPLSTLVANAIAMPGMMDDPPVTVPCGTCAHVDYVDGSTLTIPGGLHVFGRLHFPPSTNIIINTTSVTVQGHLDIGIPDEGKVIITLYGIEDQFLYPHDECCSAGALGTTCDPDCNYKKNLGKKPIIVAGGKDSHYLTSFTV